MTEPDDKQRDDERPVVVLESFGPPHGRNNPYFLLLLDSFPPSVEVRFFSWRAALLGSYDVFHLHWPEVVMRGRTPLRSHLRLVLFVLLLARIRLQRKGLVRTLHNLTPHEAVSPLQRRAMSMADRATSVWVTLSDRVEPPSGTSVVVAPHGHFRDWFAASATEPVRGRIVFCGRIRRYKGVDGLLAAFAALHDDEATLHVVGKTEDDGLAAQLRHAVDRDARIVALDDFVSDEVMSEEVRAGELVVLPFVEMTNSSSLLLALSLDRPVLVPRMPVTEEISAEVGPGWVLLYDGELDATTLAGALDAVRSTTRSAGPDLTGRAWAPIGAAHARAFRQARDLATSRSAGLPG